MASEVFRPSNGPLLVRSNLAPAGWGNPDDYRRRPSTNSGYRFGQLSHNSFFARHNPHPARVRHMKGLLDVPICAVNDEGYFANPRYTMNFPPNSFNTYKINKYSKYYIPANAINVNNQRYPINTITGLQSFMGKSLNFRIFGEAAKMRKGIMPAQEAWRDELKALREALGLSRPCDEKPMETARPRTTQYSPETGRLIPPPSRAMSRGTSRQARREDFYNKYQQYIGNQEPDLEGMLMQMLCQILQTDDVSAVQNWLVSAGDREKALVLDMIRSAIATEEEYYNQHAPEYVEPERPRTSAAGPTSYNNDALINGDHNVSQKLEQMSFENERPSTCVNQDGRWSRYSWAKPDLPKSRQSVVQREVIHGDLNDCDTKPINNEPFRSKPVSATGQRPPCAFPQLRYGSKPQTPKMKTPTEARLRYTTTPLIEQSDRPGTEAAVLTATE